MKITLQISLLAVIVFFTACGNSNSGLNKNTSLLNATNVANAINTINPKTEMAMPMYATNLSQFVTYEYALSHINAFKALNKSYAGITIPNASYFDKEQILELLSQPGCVGLKLYNSIDERNGTKWLVNVAIGVKSAGSGQYDDMIDKNNFKGLNVSQVCPPVCDSKSEFDPSK
jgi:hypothetical protein